MALAVDRIGCPCAYIPRGLKAAAPNAVRRGMGELSNKSVRARRGAVATILIAGLGLVAPATGNADYQTFGSDLRASANHVESQGADTAYWQTAFSDGRVATVPVAGQIKEIRLKGFAHSDREDGAADGRGGERMFHLQALTPEGGTVRARISSQAFDVPSRSTAGADTVTSYRPENFCVKPGEHIAFNNIGGFNQIAFPKGTPMQVFASAPGAAVSRFTADNGTNNGMLFAPRAGHPHDSTGRLGGVELLMQITLATGDDRSYECGGPNTYRPADPPPQPRAPKPPKPAPIQKTTIPRFQRVNVSRAGVAGMALFCQAGAAACNGTVTFYAGSTAIAAKRYAVGAKSTGKLKVKLTKAGHKLFLKRKRKLPVAIVAVTDPGGPAYTDTYRVTMRKMGVR